MEGFRIYASPYEMLDELFKAFEREETVSDEQILLFLKTILSVPGWAKMIPATEGAKGV